MAKYREEAKKKKKQKVKEREKKWKLVKAQLEHQGKPTVVMMLMLSLVPMLACSLVQMAPRKRPSLD